MVFPLSSATSGPQQEALSAHGYPPAPGIPAEATTGEPGAAQATHPNVPSCLPGESKEGQSLLSGRHQLG